MQNDENALVFPKKVDRARIDRYNEGDKLYFGDHFDAFNIRGVTSKNEPIFPEAYRRLRYIAANFAGLASRVVADMMFGETPTIGFKDKKNQKFADGFMEDNQMLAQLYESELGNSRRGDACFKLRVGQRNPGITDSPSTLILEEFSPSIYFPVIDEESTRNTPKQDVIAFVFTRPGGDGKPVTYLRKEIHTPGLIQNEVWTYDPKENKLLNKMNVVDFGLEEEEETGIKRSLVFHAPNVRDSSGFFGTSDYRDLKTLFFALNNRITKTDNILDKHSDPILAVPEGVLDENGNVRKESLGMFEVDNQNAGFNKPEYIVWNANLDSAFKEIDKLIQMLFMFSEVAPASAGYDDGGGASQAESGRALKFKLISTIRKRNRKIRYYDQLIKDLFETALELAKFHKIEIDSIVPSNIERPTIKWGDGVIKDAVEQAEVETQRLEGGFQSKVDAIANMDDVTMDEAADKLKRIDAENEPKLLPPSNDLNGNGTGGAGPQDPNAGNPQPPVNPQKQQPANRS